MSWRICFSLTNCHWRIVHHVFCVVLIFMKSISLQLSKFLQVFPSLLSWKDSFFLLAIPPKETGTPGIGAPVLPCRCHGFWKEVYSSVLFLFTAFKSIFMFVKKKYLHVCKKRLLQLCLLPVPLNHFKKQANSPCC